MKVVLDIEADSLDNVQHIWVVVCKDIETGDVHVFRENDKHSFQAFASNVDCWIGHNIISYDCYWLGRMGWLEVDPSLVLDTLVLSQLLNVGREGGHSLEAWGLRLSHPKGDFHDFSQWSQEMEDYCINDVHLTHKVYLSLDKVISRNKGKFDKAIDIEMKSRWIAEDMHHNGFKFDIDEAKKMREELEIKCEALLKDIQEEFPPRSKLIREVVPRLTRHGTISRVGLKSFGTDDYRIFSPEAPFSLVEFIPFSPTSPRQVVERLWEAGWKPTSKTKGHLECEKTLKSRWASKEEKAKAKERLEEYKIYGWSVNEENIATLPEHAPKACGLLVEYILTAARVRSLTEWISCYNVNTGRIHGRFNPLGTRTHRCSHSNPNMGNIATKKSIKYNTEHLRNLALEYGGRMRSLWICDEDSWLCGTDMEGAHLRIFAHLINDENFIEALVNGDKKLGTDPHSVNKRALGEVCLDRDRAKTFVFSFLNGAASPKVSQIFGCSLSLAKEALDRFVRNYPGLAKLKQEIFPRDASRGYFEGIDGRLVVCDDEHLMMGMVLQNMESVLMKYANVMWQEKLRVSFPYIQWRQVNWVHDEWVTEVRGSAEDAGVVGALQAECIAEVGRIFGLRCPMAGEYKVGKTWLEVH